jgi:O-antigen ligase
MIARPNISLTSVMFLFYALFVVTSTFSIALAQTFLGIALALFVVVLFRERFRPLVKSLKWIYVAVGLYLFWTVLSSLVGPTPVRSLQNIREEWLFLAIPIGVYLMQNEAYRKRLITLFALSIGLLSLYGLMQYLTGGHWFQSQPLSAIEGFGYRVQGNFSTRLTYANYFGTAALFLAAYALFKGRELSGRAKTGLILISGAALLATALTLSRGATAACGVTLVMLGLILGRRYYLPVLALVVALLLAVTTVPGVKERFVGGMANDLDPAYEGGRLFIWSHSVRIIAENPVIGIGAGNFYEVYGARLRPDIPQKRRLTHAHNDPLNVAALSGIPGAIFFEAMWVVVLVFLWRGFRDSGRSEQQRRICLAALMGSVVFWTGSLIEATFADEEVRQMLMFIWAAGFSVRYKDS